MGAALNARSRDFAPDAVLCSSSLRARETDQGVRENFPSLPEADVQNGLYLISAGSLLGLVQALPDGPDCVLVIAHEPGLSELVGYLAGAASAAVRERAARGMTPGAMAALRFPVDNWADVDRASGDLVEFLHPADLGDGTAD